MLPAIRVCSLLSGLTCVLGHLCPGDGSRRSSWLHALSCHTHVPFAGKWAPREATDDCGLHAPSLKSAEMSMSVNTWAHTYVHTHTFTHRAGLLVGFRHTKAWLQMPWWCAFFLLLLLETDVFLYHFYLNLHMFRPS